MSDVKIKIILRNNLASGFNLAGVEVLNMMDRNDVKTLLSTEIEKKEPVLIGIDADLFPNEDKKILKHLEENPFPVIIPLPRLEAHSKEDAEKYVAEMVRSCIGYYVKLK